jgi:nucleotide-binding universal stress UspA family protein
MVPLDGSDLAETALSHAVELGRNLQATLMLVHIYDQRSSSAEAGRRYLEFVCETRVRGAVAVESVVRKGPVVEALLHAAKKHQVDLIVMATHGRSGLQRVVYGSVAEQVLRSSDTPVLLVRAPGAMVEEPVDQPKRSLPRRGIAIEG